jgi:hypothetical protein
MDDCTTQPCEDTHDSPFTDPLAHPRPAVSYQRRDLYRPRRYLRTARQMMQAYGMTDQEMGQEKGAE